MKNQLSVNIRINEKHNGKIANHCKQRVSLNHIGLVKDCGGHLVNQSRLSLFESVAKQQLEIKWAQLEKQT